MALLELILLFVLQFEGISGQIFLYNRTGHDVFLSCDRASSMNTTCSNVTWLYNRDTTSETLSAVKNEDVDKRSARAARLSVGTDCSLLINHITAEDAGQYVCRLGVNTDLAYVHLSVLTISPSPPDADPKRDGEVTLECSLLTFNNNLVCQSNRLRWVDETGAELPGEGFGYEFLKQENCVSVLRVKHQSGNNRRYTCQLVNSENKVEVEADYTPVNTESFPSQTYIIVGAAVGGVVVLVVIAAVLVRYRKRAKVTDDVPKLTQHTDEPESNLTYITVSHANEKASPRIKVKKEEDVTYSTVKTSVMTEADPDSLYSNVSKPK